MVLFIFIALTMLLSLIGNIYSDLLFYSFIRLVRQIIGIYLIICAASTISWRPKDEFFDLVLPLVITGIYGLVIIQFVAYTFFQWTYLFVPQRLFIAGLGTIADYWLEYGKLRGFLTDVRVSGPYAEPSYLGFISLSLSILVTRSIDTLRLRFFLLGLMYIANRTALRMVQTPEHS